MRTDLSNTIIGQTVQLDHTEFDFIKEKTLSGFWPLRYQKAVNSDDSNSFRILKRHAEDAKDHERKLAFFSSEMRSDYGFGITGSKLIMYLLYDRLSDYGRSFKRPATALLLSTLFFVIAYAYSGYLINKCMTIASLISPAAILALAHTLPFNFGSRPASSQAMDFLYKGIDPEYGILIHALTITQGLISTIFLFLMGLALRNYFRG